MKHFPVIGSRLDWTQKLLSIDDATYTNKNISLAKTAGEISIMRLPPAADMLSKAELFFMPNAVAALYEDKGSYVLYSESAKATFEERSPLVDKLNQYYFDNYGPIPVVRYAFCYAWSDKISPWPHPAQSMPTYFEYVRHAQPFNTYRLFSPMTGR